MDPDASGDANISAFLHVLRTLESGNDYTSLYGGGHFADFRQHPSIKTPWNPLPWKGVLTKGGWTHAAGAYQFEPGTWAGVAKLGGLTDFSPASQDKGAIIDIKGRGAYLDIFDGDLPHALELLAPEWQSLTTHSFVFIKSLYNSYGGITQ